jgi:hypothetical protein
MEATFDGVKVFSATKIDQRQQLGEVVTEWITAHPAFEIVDIVQKQSSDAAYHCLSISAPGM